VKRSQFCVERLFEEITADVHQFKLNYIFSFSGDSSLKVNMTDMLIVKNFVREL